MDGKWIATPQSALSNSPCLSVSKLINELPLGITSLNGPGVCHVYHVHPAGQPVYARSTLWGIALVKRMSSIYLITIGLIDNISTTQAISVPIWFGTIMVGGWDCAMHPHGNRCGSVGPDHPANYQYGVSSRFALPVHDHPSPRFNYGPGYRQAASSRASMTDRRSKRCPSIWSARTCICYPGRDPSSA